jgi:Kelch motif
MKFTHHFVLVVCAVLMISSATRAGSTPPPLPRAAVSFGAVFCDGWLYVYGGNTGKAHEFNRECVKGDCFRLRMPDGVAWEAAPGGQALLGAALVAWDEKVIRIGGMNARNEKGKKNDLHSTEEVARLDPISQVWEALQPLPEPRSSHDAAVLDGTVYVGGGWRLAGDDGDGGKAAWHKTLVSLDLHAPENGWKSWPQPFERRALAVVAFGRRLWFIGGMDSKDQPARSVDWFDPATGKWGKGPDLPDGTMAGFGVAACVEGGRLFVSPFSGKVSALAADETQWEEVAQLNPPRFFHRLLPLGDGRLVAVGGSNHQGHVTQLEIVTPGSGVPPRPMEKREDAEITQKK